MTRLSRDTVDTIAQAHAEEVRRQRNFGLAPIKDAIGLLIDNGVLVARNVFSDQVSGVFFRFGKDSMVLLNGAMPLGHQQFTAAHELHHHLFDQALSFSLEDHSFSEGETIDVIANAFAAELLMPRAGIMKDYYELGLTTRNAEPQDIVRLQHRWGVSFSAVCYRLLNLKSISKQHCEQLLSTPVRSLTLRMGLNTTLLDNTPGILVSPMFTEAVVRAHELGLVSGGKVRELLTLTGKTPADIGIDVFD